jgi:predicted glycosyltransferase
MASLPPGSSQPDHATTAGQRPRILIYVQDSWGLGHIARVSKLARALQDDADCLILCGHREAGWIVPERCEYLRIPSLNTPLSKGSTGGFWGPRSHLQLPRESEAHMRRTMIQGAIDAFAPDAIIVENRPLGMSDELDGILDQTQAVKLFLTRGIMTHPRRVRSSFLNTAQQWALRTQFHKIIAAVDRQIWDMVSEYGLEADIAAKIEYVGHISEAVDASQIQRVRGERGLRDGQKWIVCSAGGGALGERLVQEFVGIVGSFPGVAIDVVQGPHSELPWPALLTSIIEEKWGRLHRECRALPLLHAAADLVVCPGGSSLLEVMEGGAPIVTISVQADPDDDQGLLSSRLARHYPITIMSNYDELGRAVTRALDRSSGKSPIRQIGTLSFDGLKNARGLILAAVNRR